METKLVEFDMDKGRDERDLGIARAANKHVNKVAIARRIAKEIAVNGPLTIDNVRMRMSESGYAIDDSPKWLAAVFKGKEWKAIGTTTSLRTVAHARPVKLWALKSWLENNPINGTGFEISAFNLIRIYNDAQKADINFDPDNYSWVIGDNNVAKEFHWDVIDKQKLYGIKVIRVRGSGAILVISSGAVLTD